MVIPNNEMYGGAGVSERACDVANTSAASWAHWLVNMIPGQITSVYQGLLKRGIRIRIGERSDLRVRWPLGSGLTPLVPGDSVKAVVPAEAVHLESGYFRLGKRRWNRWVGRIVLTEIWRDRLIVTVKLHNDPVTLKCCGSLTGRQWAPQVWDTVNIVVDPIKISLDLCMPDQTAQAVCDEAETSAHLRDTRVWLTARVTERGLEGKVSFPPHRDNPGFGVHCA